MPGSLDDMHFELEPEGGRGEEREGEYREEGGYGQYGYDDENEEEGGEGVLRGFLGDGLRCRTFRSCEGHWGDAPT